MKRGRFITVEGQDGAGKSTNIDVIAEFLKSKGVSLLQTREPGGTQIAERIRTLILDSKDQDFGDMTELLLMFAARADHIQKVIEPALSKGDWVLCDRFTDATYAYQGGGRGVTSSSIKTLQTLVQQSLRPDLTLLLDLPVEVGEQRAGERGAADRFELQKLEFKQRVRDAYLEIAQNDPARVKVINADASRAEVAKQITEHLKVIINV